MLDYIVLVGIPKFKISSMNTMVHHPNHEFSEFEIPTPNLENFESWSRFLHTKRVFLNDILIYLGNYTNGEFLG